MLSIRKLFAVETLLGIGLGVGYLTNLRFIGKVGLSEILILISIIILFSKNYKVFFIYKRNLENFIKGYILFILILQLPLITLTTYAITDYNSDPKYVVSFIMGGVLAFLLSNASQFNEFNFSKLTLSFFYVFVATNLITFIFFPSLLDVPRYTGGAENPNQLAFYGVSLSLLLIIYQKKLSIIAIPIILWILIQTKSDNFLLTVYLTIIFYLIFIFFFHSKFKFALKVIFFLIITVLASTFIINLYSEELLELWLVADSGNLRIALLQNGLDVVSQSPIVGWGAGSFSGFTPFGTKEAHSTPIDLAMQFGIIFPIIIYGMMIAVMFKKLEDREFLVAAFIVGFIISGLFHFSARHFTFWVEFSVFYTYIFHNYNKKNIIIGNKDNI
jgi:O-antigen ligase